MFMWPDHPRFVLSHDPFVIDTKLFILLCTPALTMNRTNGFKTRTKAKGGEHSGAVECLSHCKFSEICDPYVWDNLPLFTRFYY